MHVDNAIKQDGCELDQAELVVVLLHGRGADADDMLGLFRQLDVGPAAALALQASGNSWWPASFLAPLADNEAGLRGGLEAVSQAVTLVRRRGRSDARVVLIGFSQGACLALEYAARAGDTVDAVAALSGALIGTEESDDPVSDALYGHRPKRFSYAPPVKAPSVYIGCHERDPHIPLERVRESIAVFEKLGAEVHSDILNGEGHSVTEVELEPVRRLLRGRVR